MLDEIYFGCAFTQQRYLNINFKIELYCYMIIHCIINRFKTYNITIGLSQICTPFAW